MGLFSNIQHEKQNSGGKKLSPGARWDELKLYGVLTYVIVSCDDTTEIPTWISLKYGKIWLAILPVVNFSVLTADVKLTMNLLSSRYFLKFGECYWQYTNHMPNWPLSITFKWKTEEKHIPSIVWIFWEWIGKNLATLSITEFFLEYSNNWNHLLFHCLISTTVQFTIFSELKELSKLFEQKLHDFLVVKWGGHIWLISLDLYMQELSMCFDWKSPMVLNESELSFGHKVIGNFFLLQPKCFEVTSDFCICATNSLHYTLNHCFEVTNNFCISATNSLQFARNVGANMQMTIISNHCLRHTHKQP